MKKLQIIVAMVSCAAGFIAGCESDIRPMREVRRVEVWEALPDVAALTTVPGEAGGGTRAGSQASAQASTRAGSSAQATTQLESVPDEGQTAATEAATRPGRMVVKVIDPNRTTRYVYKASYDRVWQEATLLIHRMGFALERKDYRHGMLTTVALSSPQIIEPWKRDNEGVKSAVENTLHSQRRAVRLTIKTVEGKPEFFEIGVQVVVERLTNPTEALGGPIFVTGSGFGTSGVSMQSDYAEVKPVGAAWVVIGHDPKLEKKLLDALFNKI